MNIKRFGAIVLIALLSLNGITFAQEPSGRLPTTEEALAAAYVPERDLAELAQRLQGVSTIPDTPTTPQRTYQIGDVDQFWVHNDDQVLPIKARLVYMNDVLYMWVQEGYSIETNRVQQAADRFAQEVYEPARAIFGSEASPGIDGDVRLHVLHTDDLGAGIAGYFYSESQYPQEAIPSSNEREMFFISVNMFNYGVDYYLSVMAHEFQHMIHWAVDANEESWLNEGLSELSPFIAGYGPSGFSSAFLNNPNTQVNDWPQGATRPVYGGAFLMMAYIQEQYGIEAIRSLVANPENGVSSLQAMLNEIGATDPVTGNPMTAEALFADWTIANYTMSSGRYGYQNAQLRSFSPAAPTQIYNSLPVIQDNTTVNQFGTRYYRLNNAPSTVEISFLGNSSVELLPETAHSSQFAYWSNRVDSSDTRLTRTFDLSSVNSATLSYWTWYDIEDGWDYAYVMVSPDGGASWDILETEHSTTRNPHGTSYGPGYTGRSGGWVQETVDLSAYAGQPVTLRFEYITDDATLSHGMLIDDVSIPEIGYFTDFETFDDSWQAEGWAQIDNTLRQHFSVQLIKHHQDNTISVERLMFVEDEPAAQWTVNLDETVNDITIAVSGLTRVTTQPATFSLLLMAEN